MFTAEELCIHTAKYLGVGTLTLQLYALAKPDLSLWYPPNHEVLCEETCMKEFLFRIRFLPASNEIQLTHLYRKDQKTFDYLYLQCRDDFVNDRIEYKSNDIRGKKIGQEHLLGLGVIDMLRFGKDKKYDLSKLKSLDPSDFISLSSKGSFKFFFDKKRLSLNFKPHLEKEFKTAVNDKVVEVKLRYMRALLSYAKKYCIETFKGDVSNYTVKVVVDPYDPEVPGIFCEIVMHDTDLHVSDTIIPYWSS